MDLRKVQATGGSSLSVVLPKNWASSNSIKDKDSVWVEETQEGIVIRPLELKNGRKYEKLEINAGKISADMLTREMAAGYISGVEELVINGNSITLEQMKLIRKAVTELPGFEIVESSFDQIVIKNIYDHHRLPTSQAMQKLFLMVQQMFKDVIEAISESNVTEAKGVIERDDEVDKLYKIISRQLYLAQMRQNSGSGNENNLTREEAHFYDSVAANLERIADHTVNIAKYYLQSEESLSDWMNDPIPRSICNILTQILDDSGEMTRKADKQMAHSVMDRCDKLEQQVRAFSMTNYRRKSHFPLIIASFGRIRSYTMNIAEFTLGYAVSLQVRK